MSMSNRALRSLPAVTTALHHPSVAELQEYIGPEFLTTLAREAVDELRAELLANKAAALEPEDMLQAVVDRLRKNVEELRGGGLRRVINATGIILHTGLGRALLSPETRDKLAEIAQGYCDLELALQSGKRGDRQSRVARLLQLLTGASGACVVNNNAAAVVLVLNTLADRREVVVSRGELVEIGGSFRLPEIIKKSGARLVEVGTTNKTRASDYARAITAKTGVLLKVHQSNYRIQGFTEQALLSEIIEIGKAHRIPVVHDLGGGILVDLRRFGLPAEPVVADSVKAGANLATFSGDKIIGGPQAGIIVGGRDFVDEVCRNPLMRALRCDKLTVALLESSLRIFLQPEQIVEHHPVLRMLSESQQSVQARALRIAETLREVPGLEIVVEKSHAVAGSGALPVEPLPSYAVGVRAENFSDAWLAAHLRQAELPVIGYARDGWLWLDARTIDEAEVAEIAKAFAGLAR